MKIGLFLYIVPIGLNGVVVMRNSVKTMCYAGGHAARHCERSETIQRGVHTKLCTGLLRCARNDGINNSLLQMLFDNHQS
jgi:hypothetical protein